MKLLLLGPAGQLGRALQRSLPLLGPVQAWDRHHGGDLSAPQTLADAVRAFRPQCIVNAAAYTAVDQAEDEAALAHAVNAQAPGLLARVAAEIGAGLVHYSTDYVFDGQGTRPWTETDAPAPLNVYGQTKLEGERAIAASGCRHLVFRTSWVYGQQGGNFARTLLRLACEREELSVVNDQWGAPTSAELLAEVTVQALRAWHAHPDRRGLYHLVASGHTTWHGYAEFLIAQARALHPDWPWRVQRIVPVPSSAYPRPARRPLNSRLSTQRLQSDWGLSLPDWREGVRAWLQQLDGPPL